MSRKRWLIVLAGVVAATVGFVGYAMVYHFNFRPVTTIQGSNPRIVVAEQNGWGDEAIWGVVTYDPQTDCLYLDQAAEFMDFPSRSTDLRYGIAWPKTTRAVTSGDRRGVRMDAFLGRIGGTVILDGDHVWLGGATSPPPSAPDDCAGPDGWVTIGPGGEIADQPGPRPFGPPS